MMSSRNGLGLDFLGSLRVPLTRNGATAREIHAYRTGAQPNFFKTAFSEVGPGNSYPAYKESPYGGCVVFIRGVRCPLTK
jgi:hypothetical protein